ncbi:hypothetical protein AO726_09655 [Pseudomonas sp. TTU2014-080ASC]|nr:hypothetical protein AO726_09655 [Pseudomonas sp. TTU2014-080ASC]
MRPCSEKLLQQQVTDSLLSMGYKNSSYRAVCLVFGEKLCGYFSKALKPDAIKNVYLSYQLIIKTNIFGFKSIGLLLGFWAFTR